MKITIISIGKTKADAAGDLIAEYQKRLRGQLHFLELPASKDSNVATRKAREATSILAAIPKGAAVLVLDEGGKNPTSIQLADKIRAWQNRGFSELCAIIGGADGLDKTVLARADYVCAFGAMTWPHRLVRVMISEQLYRAFSILSGHPYHRE
jgi:23S rRNA (pseudouridine1915-N3)-methyltransferase